MASQRVPVQHEEGMEVTKRRTATAGAWQAVTRPPARGLPRPGWTTLTSTTPSATAPAVHAP